MAKTESSSIRQDGLSGKIVRRENASLRVEPRPPIVNGGGSGRTTQTIERGSGIPVPAPKPDSTKKQ